MRSITRTLATGLAIAAAWCSPATPAAARRADGQLAIEVVDAKTGEPIAARMHLYSNRGRPARLRVPALNQFGDHFYIDGKLVLPLRRGQYKFELEAGPEYRDQSGGFEINRHADDSERIEMRRFADLADEGWWAGDLDVMRQPEDLPLAMRAEALSVVPNRSADSGRAVGEQNNAVDGMLMVGGHRIARTPFEWNLPVWLAKDEVDAISLVNHHALRGGVVDNEGEGRERDRALFPGAHGNGRWSEAIYYHVLNCGLRIPPAAGSGSGENQSPIGTNRVYVHCGKEFSEEAWWDGLEAGRVFVTNGPLLRPMVEGQPPGYVFHLEPGSRLSLEIGLELATREPIEYLQIIKNGQPDVEVRLDELVANSGRLPSVVFDQSGWFLVRAVTNNRKTYQFASSGPYYVEVGGEPRISRRSVEFFLDWITAAEERIREMPDIDEARRNELLAEQAAARQFFVALLDEANTD